MKKKILILGLVGLSTISFGQWGGSTTQTGNIYRTGNVGIGTTAPGFALDISTSQVNGGLRITQTTNNMGSSAISLRNLTTGGREYVIGSTGTGNAQGAGHFSIYDMNGATDRFIIKSGTGNVGIGTTNATAKLTVNGNVLIGDPATTNLPVGYKLYVETGILTEKVKVAVKNSANWADYVFAPNYKLRSLGEVESFVLANKHLPGIPSAEEVVKDGVDLGEMNAKLLEKVEELTIYLIEQNKKIEVLQKEVNSLK